MAWSKRTESLVLLLALALPTLVTWVYFDLLADRGGGAPQIAYLIGKTLQFALPVAWMFTSGLWKWPREWPRTEGIGVGVAFAMLAVGHGVMLYFGWLRTSPVAVDIADRVKEKVVQMGLAHPASYLLAALFYALVHSALEELYWRWFVFGRMRQHTTPGWANVVSSLAFSAHHFLVLGIYCGGFHSPLPWVLGLAVALGGSVWALIYHRTNSLWGPWISHLLVDAAIFAIGYDLALEVITR